MITIFRDRKDIPRSILRNFTFRFLPLEGGLHIKFRRVKEPCPSDYDGCQERGASRERQAVQCLSCFLSMEGKSGGRRKKQMSPVK